MKNMEAGMLEQDLKSWNVTLAVTVGNTGISTESDKK